MINKDSIVTAYDEHLTLVEWLQKVEKLLANGSLKSTTLNDKGNATFSLTLTFNDNTAITSPDMTLTSINEALTALDNSVEDIKDGATPLFETITDNHGNKRFIEGNITIWPINGITQTYGKWSLSGSHLMIVICIDLENVTLANDDLAVIDLPVYIRDKITPLWRNQYVDRKSFTMWDDSGSSGGNINVYLGKGTNLAIKFQSTATITALNHMRIQFDLLIDNE